MNLAFKNRYLDLGEDFYERIKPTPVTKPGLIIFNYQLAAELGLSVDDLKEDFLAGIFPVI